MLDANLAVADQTAGLDEATEGRSTIHRFGSTLKPFISSLRFTIFGSIWRCRGKRATSPSSCPA